MAAASQEQPQEPTDNRTFAVSQPMHTDFFEANELRFSSPSWRDLQENLILHGAVVVVRGPIALSKGSRLEIPLVPGEGERKDLFELTEDLAIPSDEFRYLFVRDVLSFHQVGRWILPKLRELK